MAFPDDPDLINRFKDGDVSAFEELVRKHQDRIYNLCRYMVQDAQEAQDAAQDVFLKAYGSLKAFRPDASLYTWLYRIAVNTCLDYRRKARPEQTEDESVIDDLASTEPSPEQHYQSKEIGQTIQLALQKLPEQLRAAVVLKEIEDLSYEEIAKVLDTSIGTVKSRISRAREELRRLLQKKV
ncbi:MAG TPA: sigma-70 family RNA polymerase sigma factor [Syntrophorhabdales bacterium]|nr:sigma-70 family RNA polymerase sigma factor [Syntrophorhabdales bacterium]